MTEIGDFVSLTSQETWKWALRGDHSVLYQHLPFSAVPTAWPVFSWSQDGFIFPAGTRKKREVQRAKTKAAKSLS